jgi:hypothetical protein
MCLDLQGSGTSHTIHNRQFRWAALQQSSEHRCCPSSFLHSRTPVRNLAILLGQLWAQASLLIIWPVRYPWACSGTFHSGHPKNGPSLAPLQGLQQERQTGLSCAKHGQLVVATCSIGGKDLGSHLDSLRKMSWSITDVPMGIAHRSLATGLASHSTPQAKAHLTTLASLPLSAHFAGCSTIR